jgi:hypothetical protein
MGSRLVNVRLAETHVRKARHLRDRGIALSDLVRDAIDERFEAVSESDRPTDAGSVIARILKDFPDPPDLPRRQYDLRDRKAIRAAILQKLRRRRAAR